VVGQEILLAALQVMGLVPEFKVEEAFQIVCKAVLILELFVAD
jgi:hypothetical protein